MLVIIDSNGAIVNAEVFESGEALASAGKQLKKAMRAPMQGPPREPDSVRASTAELVAALQKAHPKIPITQGHTPELDTVMEAMFEDFGRLLDITHADNPASKKAIKGFIDAASRVYREAPWETIDDESTLIHVTCDALNIHDAVLVVIGQMGEARGLILFASSEDFQAFGPAADSGEFPRASYIGMHFEEHDQMPAMRDEARKNGWDALFSEAVAWIGFVNAEYEPEPPGDLQYAQIEATARAFCELLHMDEFWDYMQGESDKPASMMAEVKTSKGKVGVTMEGPFLAEDSAPVFESAKEIRELFAELVEFEVDMDPEVLQSAHDGLLDFFERTTDGASDARSTCLLAMDFAVAYFNKTILDLKPAELEEILFEIFPRKVMMPASQAAATVHDLRTLYRFFDEELKLEQAEACLGLLDKTAVSRLEESLANPGNFGMAKSLFSGEDWPPMTESGVNDFGVPLDSHPASSSARHRAPTPQQKKKRKDKRKAARKSRKKNR